MNTGTVARLADIYARSLLDLAKEAQIVEADRGRSGGGLDPADAAARVGGLPRLAVLRRADQAGRDPRRAHRQAGPPDGQFPVRHDRAQSRGAAAQDSRPVPAAVSCVSGLRGGLGDRGAESESGADPPSSRRIWPKRCGPRSIWRCSWTRPFWAASSSVTATRCWTTPSGAGSSAPSVGSPTRRIDTSGD